jgi:hypothetical protein
MYNIRKTLNFCNFITIDKTTQKNPENLEFEFTCISLAPKIQ